NGYIDLGTYAGITPYVGAGIGTSYLETSNISYINPNGATGTWHGAGQWNFAWALQAGVGYEVNERLTLEAGYRYINLGDAESGTVRCLPVGSCTYQGLKIKDIDSHDLRLGMRWLLDAPVAVERVEPNFAPIIRKY
ncbi:MAG TPA: outer membrane beta-barrel protein, partial [Kaistiaceae bacterium]|nr:outer membrane beta-barrel protein [Kaistiaceae bacterium]